MGLSEFFLSDSPYSIEPALILILLPPPFTKSADLVQCKLVSCSPRWHCSDFNLFIVYTNKCRWIINISLQKL